MTLLDALLCGRTANSVRTYQNVGGNAKALVQLPNHVDRERAASIENLSDASTTAQKRFEIPTSQPTALHVVAQGVDWIRRLNRLVLRLVTVDESREDFKPVTGGCAWPGIHQTLNLFERGAVISLRLDWANLHGDPQRELMSSSGLTLLLQR